MKTFSFPEMPMPWISIVPRASAIEAIAFSADGAHLFISEQDAVWQHFLNEKHTPPRQLSAVHDPLKLTAHPGGTTLAIAENRLLRVIDISSGTERWRRRFAGKPQHTYLEVWDAAFSPDGALLAAVADDSLYLFDAATGQQVWQRTQRWMDKHCVAWSHDGSRLATGDYALRIWHAAGAQWPPAGRASPLTVATHYSYGIAALAFSSDGAYIATAGEGPIIIWDAATGAEVCRLGEDEASWRSVAFNALGTLLACAGTTTLRLFAVATWSERYRSTTSATQVIFHPAGHLLAEVAGSVHLLRLPRTWTEPGA